MFAAKGTFLIRTDLLPCRIGLEPGFACLPCLLPFSIGGIGLGAQIVSSGRDQRRDRVRIDEQIAPGADCVERLALLAGAERDQAGRQIPFAQPLIFFGFRGLPLRDQSPSIHRLAPPARPKDRCHSYSGKHRSPGCQGEGCRRRPARTFGGPAQAVHDGQQMIVLLT